MIEGGIQYSGYIDIKQPPKVKGRKLKSWKKKWVVVHEMSIRSASRSAAKVDVYTDEKTAKNSPADKQTFILEFVTDVRSAKSKTHLHAFEVVEREPALLLAGSTELDTQSWMSTFKKIFFPEQEEYDVFPVSIIPNEHATRLSLKGAYSMTVNPEVIVLTHKEKNLYEWSLNMLKRFHLVTDTENPTVEILSIECGPKSECGEAIFQFRSEHVTKILASIKANIFIALDRKKTEKQDKQDKQNPAYEKTARTSVVSNSGSIESATSGNMEQRYKDLLESSTSNLKTKQMKSQNSENSLDSENTGETSDGKQKHRSSVTFETSVINESKLVDDLLSSPTEVSEEDIASDYNTVEFYLPKSKPQVGNIISTFTVAKVGYETKVLLDENGYSHVDIKNSKPVFSDANKTRTLSNMSSHSSVSCRSASVGSRDSGIVNTAADKAAQFERRTAANRSSNSFDSAVSTSSTLDGKQSSPIDTNATNLTIEIQEIEVTHEEFKNGCINTEREVTMMINDNGIYQDVSLDETKSDEKDKQDSAYARAYPKLRKCNSTGDFKTDEKENEYEDLDNFRKGKKNLIKHLGMDPTIDPKSVPPSLPERPSSYKTKRKFNTGDKKLFTLPFTKNKNRKQKERAISISSSSDSDSESTRGSNKADMAVKVWPLGNKSVIAGNEDLYQPIAIERFLKDNDGMSVPQKRERSSSLNLNMSSAMKRHTAGSVRNSEPVDRRNTLWKHNRNVSMQVDMLNRPNEAKGLKRDFDISLQPGLIVRNNEDNSESVDMESDDEPIYAEVGPTIRPSSGDIENPFPDLTVWTPADISDVAEVNELDETKYENDESMQSVNNAGKSGDMLNQGFVIDDEIKTCDNCDNESMLIDLSETDSTHNFNSTKTAIDIFNMGMGTSLLETSTHPQRQGYVSTTNEAVNFIDIFHLGCGTPLPSSSSDLLNKSVMPVISETETNPSSNLLTSHVEGHVTSSSVNVHESIYMDMSSCKNESIYVLPSSLKR